MAVEIPRQFRDLLDTKALAHLGTVMPDGSPQVTPVWFDFAGGHVRVNSAKGRLKDKNMRRDPRVALSIVDPSDAYRYLEIRGRVVDITEEGAVAHINSLAKKYLGLDTYPYLQPGMVRVIYRIEPLGFSSMG
jgi:PPOX class probable F420-dependent enzyme